MMIVIVYALWEHVPISNFSQGISRVQLGESQVELGTQILLGDEHSRLISCDESCCDVKLTSLGDRDTQSN